MNNETIKKVDVTIKFGGDNVYDLYLNGEYISSRGSYEKILDEMYSVAKGCLIGWSN